MTTFGRCFYWCTSRAEPRMLSSSKLRAPSVVPCSQSDSRSIDEQIQDRHVDIPEASDEIYFARYWTGKIAL